MKRVDFFTQECGYSPEAVSLAEEAVSISFGEVNYVGSKQVKLAEGFQEIANKLSKDDLNCLLDASHHPEFLRACIKIMYRKKDQRSFPVIRGGHNSATKEKANYN